MRTHGHMEGNITHLCLLGGGVARGEIAGDGDWEGLTFGEIPNVDDEGMDAANHHSMCKPVQQSCTIFTCTPEPKVQ